MLQAKRPMLLLCDVESVAIVKAAEQNQPSSIAINVKQYRFREPGESKVDLGVVREQTVVIFRHLMSCLMELEATFV